MRLDRNYVSTVAKRVRLLPPRLPLRLMVMAFVLYTKLIWVQIPKGLFCSNGENGKHTWLKPKRHLRLVGSTPTLSILPAHHALFGSLVPMVERRFEAPCDSGSSPELAISYLHRLIDMALGFEPRIMRVQILLGIFDTSLKLNWISTWLRTKRLSVRITLAILPCLTNWQVGAL